MSTAATADSNQLNTATVSSHAQLLVDDGQLNEATHVIQHHPTVSPPVGDDHQVDHSAAVPPTDHDDDVTKHVDRINIQSKIHKQLLEDRQNNLLQQGIKFQFPSTATAENDSAAQPLTTAVTKLHRHQTIGCHTDVKGIPHIRLNLSDTSMFEHQVGGHGIGQRIDGLLMLPNTNSVLKPLLPGRKGVSEKEFYSWLIHKINRFKLRSASAQQRLRRQQSQQATTNTQQQQQLQTPSRALRNSASMPRVNHLSETSDSNSETSVSCNGLHSPDIDALHLTSPTTSDDELDDADDDLSLLRSYVPKCYGFADVVLDDHITTKEYIHLHDVTKRYRLPCVLDIKIGARTYDEHATAEKIRRETVKYQYQSELGFRITGMKVYDHSLGKYRCYNKYFGRSLTPTTIVAGFAHFLDTGRPDGQSMARRVLPTYITRCQTLLAWFEQQRKYRFYASSLLFIFEGDMLEEDDAAAHTQTSSLADSIDDLKIKERRNSTSSQTSNGPHGQKAPSVPSDTYMIDFSHVYEITDGRRDEGYIHGLKVIVKLMQKLLQMYTDTEQQQQQQQAATAADSDASSDSTQSPVQSPNASATIINSADVLSPSSLPLLVTRPLSEHITLLDRTEPMRPPQTPRGDSKPSSGDTTDNSRALTSSEMNLITRKLSLSES